MPIYEYQCNDCGHQFEAMRKISAGPPDACPACGENALQKLVSKVAFRLKGTGWYETDFKTKPADKKSGESGDSGDSGDSGSGDKKDTAKKSDSGTTSDTAKKPAAKSEN